MRFLQMLATFVALAVAAVLVLTVWMAISFATRPF